MTDLRPDRSLRLMVAKLRRLPDSDFRAIVDQLDDDQRMRVMTLVDDFDGRPELEVKPPANLAMTDNVIIPDKISPWLAARINGRADSGEETDDQFMLTSHAQAALRRCAASLVPDAPVPPRAPSLASRIWKRL